MTGPTRRNASAVLRDAARMPYRERVLNRQTPVPSLVEVVRDRFGFATWYVFADGTMLRPIAGGDGTSDNGGAGTGGGQGGDSGGQATGAATLTQADVNAIIARETAKAKADAEAALLQRIGATDADTAANAIKTTRDAEDAAKTQAQRDADAAAAANAEAARLKNEAATERHHARLERALSKAGLDVDNGVLLRAGLAAIDITPDADAAAVTAAVDKLKQDAPALFGASTGGSTGGTHSDAGGQRSKEQQTGGEFGSRGAQEAARRWNTGSKSA